MSLSSISGTLTGGLRHIVLGMVVVAGMQGAQAQEISKAEKTLFLTNHFKGVSPPKVLNYRYVQNGTEAPGFKDDVVLDIRKKNDDGSVVLSSRFLSDARQIDIPAVEQFEGNPAIQGFLERDINEMKRLTGGSTNYFRKRIRLALAESAKVEPVKVNYGGREVEGQKITISPYLGDPMQAKFPKYIGKQYTFVLSEKVPGSVYEIRSSVPSATTPQPGQPDGGSKLIEETMTLAG